MKKTLIASLVLVSSIAGIAFAGNNGTGQEVNPPSNNSNGPNTDVNGTNSPAATSHSNSNNY